MEASTLKRLTKREIGILQLIAEGLSTNELAEKLYLSSYTIYTHRRNILRKTGKKDITAVIMMAIQHKLVHTAK
jgi:DNA-binding NarL/FixJ family response regulator